MRQGKRVKKLLAIVGCCLLGGGVLLAGAGFAAMGWSLDVFTYGSAEPPQPLSASYSQGAVAAVEVDVSQGDVTIVGAGAGGDLEVSYSTLYSCQVEDGRLVIRDAEGRRAGAWKWYQLWNISWGARDDGISIAVPWDMLLSFDVTSGTGDLRLEDLDAENVTAAGDTGDIRLRNVTGTDFAVTQGVGDVSLTSCQGEGLSLSTDVGDAQVDSCQFGDTEMEASTGDITVGSSEFASLTVDGDVGNADLLWVTCQSTLASTTGVGDLSVWMVESPDIRLAADTGKIGGTIQGDQNDYQISVDCEIGYSTLKDQVGPGKKKLQVTTGVGDIGLTFVGEEDEGYD